MDKLNFGVNSRIATLLSNEYSSTERALIELIDNAWDADATRVLVDIPEPLSGSPIVVSDNGNGMTVDQIRTHYLQIAADRRRRSGDSSIRFKRKVKGSKGIGKFSGLMAAAEMHVDTAVGGRRVKLSFTLEQLKDVDGIDELQIPYTVSVEDEHVQGTTITLSQLRQGGAYPDAVELRHLLVQSYGRRQDMVIEINGKPLDVDDVQGHFEEKAISVPGITDLTVRFALSERKTGMKSPGIQIRVGSRIVGRPSLFGLDQRGDISPKLLKKLYGEIDLEGVVDANVASWEALVAGDPTWALVQERVRDALYESYQARFKRDMSLARARLQQQFNKRMSELPEYKREFADKAIMKVLNRYSDEPHERVAPMVAVLLDALESSDYRLLLEHIAGASNADVSRVADSLNDFGLADMAHLVDQARARSAVLDALEDLSRDRSTLEATMHRALESNLWVFGPEFALFSSNKTLRRMVEDYLDQKYAGTNATDRPDLMLKQNFAGEYLLIEFKRPAHALTVSDYQQATGYRHHFGPFTPRRIRVFVVGGDRGTFPTNNLEPDVVGTSFLDVISMARTQLEWQLK
ncbi:ATP-binding protein [Stenotrophomonas maltophilia]|uniref:ATP-binding protein n=1 Tax=Stenotrophomonas maltophilia TaxID=40324 RepID=A0AAJ2TR59_STEMA|nr:ATP-binding protein [Stenotrophomonas maltophilia]MBH1478414.1 ATP-binding protein [Stenotrophomonas maltophilia]MBH1503757.1 ATP-binding protein [Stenotrophomonas maltophilia]MDG2506783.1 ATP-binding protein [Stenotrophomonas maltophilia]MDZ5764664.1 ATP-binding protein [Stenotrophomonas maltophilia]